MSANGAEAMFRQCLKRTAYRTFDRVEKVKKKRELQGAQGLRSYYCTICSNFHLTSKPLHPSM